MPTLDAGPGLMTWTDVQALKAPAPPPPPPPRAPAPADLQRVNDTLVRYGHAGGLQLEGPPDAPPAAPHFDGPPSGAGGALAELRNIAAGAPPPPPPNAFQSLAGPLGQNAPAFAAPAPEPPTPQPMPAFTGPPIDAGGALALLRSRMTGQPVPMPVLPLPIVHQPLDTFADLPGPLGQNAPPPESDIAQVQLGPDVSDADATQLLGYVRTKGLMSTGAVADYYNQQFARLAAQRPQAARAAVLALQTTENVTGAGPFGSMSPLVSATLGLGGAGALLGASGLAGEGLAGSILKNPLARAAASVVLPEAAQHAVGALPHVLQAPAQAGVGFGAIALGGEPAVSGTFPATGQLVGTAVDPATSPGERAFAIGQLVAMGALPTLGPRLGQAAAAFGESVGDFIQRPEVARIVQAAQSERGSVGPFPGEEGAPEPPSRPQEPAGAAEAPPAVQTGAEGVQGQPAAVQGEIVDAAAGVPSSLTPDGLRAVADAQQSGRITSADVGDILAGRATLADKLTATPAVFDAPPAGHPAPEPAGLPPSEPVPSPEVGAAPAASAEGGGTGEPPAGPTATGGLPPEEPPGGHEVLPPVTAKLVKAMQGVTLSADERARLLREGRSRQAGGARAAALGEGTADQRLARAKGAMSGDLLPGQTPLGEQFTPQDVTQLHDQIKNALTTDKISSFEWTRATDAFQRLMMGGKQLQPGERRLLGRIFGPDFEAAIPETPQELNIWKEAVGVLGIPQAFTASFDLSAPLRQGWVLGASHPITWSKTFLPMVKAAATDAGANAVMKTVEENPWVRGTGELDGYGFRDVGGHISELGLNTEAGAKEGQFASFNNSWISRQVQRFPGIQHSERGFTVMINKLRSDVYASEARRMWDGGVRDVHQYEALAETINHATGYGSGPVGEITQGVNAFFSPRNLTARFQVLTDPFTKPGSLLKPSARQLAAKNLLAFVAMNAGMVELLHVMGVGNVTWDPRKTDFGKLVSGNTRVDPWAGFSPMARIVAQEITGQHVGASGSITPADRRQLAINFVRGKLGPVPSLLTDLFQGQNGIGEPTDFTSVKGARTQLYNRMVPFFAQDMNDAIRQSGAKGGLLAAPGFFGSGVLTYDVPSTDLLNARNKAAQQQGFKDFGDLQAKGTRAQVDAVLGDPDVQAQTARYQKAIFAQNPQGAALHQAQVTDDQKLESGQMSVTQWRDALTTRRAVQGFQQASRPDSKTGDPVLDGYYAIFKNPALIDQTTGQTVDAGALGDAIDGYRAQLSNADLNKLDNSTGLGTTDTPTVRQYHAAVQKIAASGYFDLDQGAWGAMQHTDSKLQVFASFGDFEQTLVAHAIQSGDSPAAAAGRVARLPIVRRYNAILSQGRALFRAANPAITGLLVQWGFKTPSAVDLAAAGG